MAKLISIILPCHNEEKNLPLITKEIITIIPIKYSLEIICVDDGSTDNTKQIIKILAKKYKNIKGVFLYKNFGHQAALRAGISVSKGDAVITMDADFQHPTKKLLDFIKLWESGYDLVMGKKISDRNASFWTKFRRKIGYSVWEKVTDGIIIPGVSDFRLMSKPIATYINSLKESEAFLRGVAMLSAKNPIIVPYNVGKRRHGKSSYTLNMFINMFLNGFISFSTKPIRIASFLGLIFFFLSAIALSIDVMTAIIAGKKIIEGWLTAVFLIILFNGIILIYLGLLGEYIGVIFREVKKRPKFLIEETINFKND